ncbi:cystathionine beta-lyase [Apiospora arundinis]
MTSGQLDIRVTNAQSSPNIPIHLRIQEKACRRGRSTHQITGKTRSRIDTDIAVLDARRRSDTSRRDTMATMRAYETSLGLGRGRGRQPIVSNRSLDAAVFYVSGLAFCAGSKGALVIVPAAQYSCSMLHLEVLA